MTSRKSQITLFVILGLVIVLAFLFSISLSKNKLDNTEDNDIKPIRAFAASCLEEKAKEAFYILGLQNGIELRDYASLGGNKINYAYYNNESKALGLNEIEEQVAGYVKANMPECINGFDAFPGVIFQDGSFDVNILTGFTETTVAASYDATVSIGKTSYTLGEFSRKIPIRMPLIQNTVEYIARHYPDIELYDYLGTNPINVTIYPIDDELFFVITDKKSNLDNIPYKYVFSIMQ